MEFRLDNTDHFSWNSVVKRSYSKVKQLGLALCCNTLSPSLRQPQVPDAGPAAPLAILLLASGMGSSGGWLKPSQMEKISVAAGPSFR